LLAAVEKVKRRDLVIKLLWQGSADLDLKVNEPTGSICTPLSRQTVNGVTLLADALDNMQGETYVAAEGFSGAYTITAERIWGKSRGKKAHLKTSRPRGPGEERDQLLPTRITPTRPKRVTVKLDNGRRKELAYVPPSSAHLPVDYAPPVRQVS